MKEKKLKQLTKILAIVIICLVSFVGIYKQNTNRMENQVKNYQLGKDLVGYRELVFKVSDATEVLDSEGKKVGNTDEYTDSTIESNSYQKTENKINQEENLTKENYKKAKAIIENRLNSFGIDDYNIAINEEDGSIYLQLPEDSQTDHTVSNLLQVAKFEIKDSEDTSKVLLTNNDLKKISTVYNTTSDGTTVYLQIEFNKNGKKVLKEISSGEYVTKNSTESENTTEDTNTSEENSTEENSNAENTNAENNTNSEKSENTEETNKEDNSSENQKKIILSIDSNDMITTSFDTPIVDGTINLSMNKATTDSSSISDTLQSASTIAAVVNSGEMPITYKVSENNYVESDLNLNEKLDGENKKIVIGIIIVLAAILIIYLIIKYKLKGLITGISYLGLVGLYLLVVRYTNVLITLESIVSIIIIMGINYIILLKMLQIKENDKELRMKELNKVFKSIIIKTIPIFIISIVFIFIHWTKISSFGMGIFWGLILSIIYNYVVTRKMLD